MNFSTRLMRSLSAAKSGVRHERLSSQAQAGSADVPSAAPKGGQVNLLILSRFPLNADETSALPGKTSSLHLYFLAPPLFHSPAPVVVGWPKPETGRRPNDQSGTHQEPAAGVGPNRQPLAQGTLGRAVHKKILRR